MFRLLSALRAPAGCRYRSGSRWTVVLGLSGALVSGTGAGARAEVVRVEVVTRESVLGGRSFGPWGAYEKLTGRIYFSFDPGNPANARIVDLALAPLDAEGRVRAWADFMVIQPVNPARRRGVAWLEVSNRGGKASLRYFNRALRGASDPTVAEDFGDGLLLREGLTLIWVGWQMDLPDDPRLLRLHGPLLRAADGRPLEGWVRADWVVEAPTPELALGHRDHRPYRPIRPGSEEHVLTVRDAREGARAVVAREQWHFATAEDGPDAGQITHVVLEGGFQPGRIYELVYRGRDPRPVGLGLAVVRDVVSYAKHDLDAVFPATHGIAFGVSQTGRFLRHFLHQGFNVDERGRRAFDGVLIHTAGAGRGSFNHRFAQPSRDAHRYSAFFYPTDLYPFASLPQPDPLTGREEGLLDALPQPLRPRVMTTNTGYEYWGRTASLVHTTVDGAADAPAAPGERLYHLAGGQHYVGPFPPDSGSALAEGRGFAGNPLEFLVTLRALAVRLVAWVADGVPPPPSGVPAIARGTLVPPAALAFPAIPGVEVPTEPHVAYRADYGPRFLAEGIADVQPPRLGEAFPALVPQVDAFGNELGGVRGVELRAPLATYTPWRVRRGLAGGNGELHDFEGAFYPLPTTAAAAAAAGDPRPPLERLYGDRTGYRTRVEAAAAGLATEGFLLDEDVAYVVERALALWDWIHAREGG
ncbi:MAG: alpha/beta hydrolase domain-containing protein [Longimicrobiales bacterium]|nr:alpha/beta hydrolase domain-containing protein [Longimicrobiales bacterium]